MDGAATIDDDRAAVLTALQALAPEANLAAVDATRALRAQVDLDSLDWLNLLDAVGERLGVPLDGARIAPDASLDDLAAAVRRQRAAIARRRQRASPGNAIPRHTTLADTTAAKPPRPAALPIPRRPLRLGQGRRVTLRPITAADAPREAAFVRGLSTASRYKRFMSSLRELTPAKLKYFTDVDQQRHLALAATATGDRKRAWVGVARCVADPQGDGCEFAVTVADDWQGSGLAGLLMRVLMHAAKRRGFKTMHGVVLASNRRMLTLARQLGFVVQRDHDEPGTVKVQRAL
ncbi:GNAT family N-acetyltransferase [Calidifontimicrobium sp. SYSU G02091]|uniref:GNAT family N-acetyltransferase n=1 Tax=Calidifontimicrobium sp. SYSU G02091 TaxID=2926421 RepID=UPI001F53543D|nr:GNAT family N-acetyltransferase [Calidifontimicrobium sp. SYSU G02091]MCI1192813.1 GNAT family N-acetyltransferase [Calidifontimicrobium sp. SYSU G02091]